MARFFSVRSTGRRVDTRLQTRSPPGVRLWIRELPGSLGRLRYTLASGLPAGWVPARAKSTRRHALRSRSARHAGRTSAEFFFFFHVHARSGPWGGGCRSARGRQQGGLVNRSRDRRARATLVRPLLWEAEAGGGRLSTRNRKGWYLARRRSLAFQCSFSAGCKAGGLSGGSFLASAGESNTRSSATGCGEARRAGIRRRSGKYTPGGAERRLSLLCAGVCSLLQRLGPGD